MNRACLLTALALATPWAPAQETGEEMPIAPEGGEMEVMEVTAAASGTPLLTLGAASMQTVRTVETETLRRNAQGTLGETLGWEPGVSSGYFGPGASRPVIRGFEGVRVRTLRDDLSTFDLSDISPDHGVAIEPFLQESVEIHRGPASLLYGNSAIGGAVNARSRTLARERTEALFYGGWESRFDSVSDGFESAGYFTLRSGDFLLRFTGSRRDAEDIRIPGKARTRAYDELENPRYYDPSTRTTVPVPNPDGRLPNSSHDSSTWSAGISWIPETLPFRLGVSYSRFDSLYGVPFIFDGDSTDLSGDTGIDIGQDRFDFEGAAEFDQGFISKIETRAAYAAYRHFENFTGTGKDTGRDYTETYLEKDAFEARIDIHHRAFDDRLTGVFGVSGMHEDLTAVFALTPPPSPIARITTTLRSDNIGFYALETFEAGDWSFHLGQRFEHVDLLDDSMKRYGFTQGEADWSSSTSGSITWNKENIGPLDRLSVTGIVSLVERQPGAIERYAFWNNAGIGRFLIGGDLDGTPLHAEESLGYEIGIQAEKGPVKARLNAYYYDFDNFIFLQEDPAATGGFGRAASYIERAATFTGFESELEWKIYEEAEKSLTLTLMGDYVEATNETDGEPIPRMPPLRFGSRLEWRDERLTLGLEVRHATAQDRVKPEPRPELPADAYTLVNADASWKFPVKDQQLTVFLRLTNLLDEEARVSTSFRKDVAPLPGRGVCIGFRHEF